MFFSPKYGGPKFPHHSNLNLSLDSLIGDWSRTATTIVLTILDQFEVFVFQLGTDLSDEQFLGHCILDWETLNAIDLKQHSILDHCTVTYGLCQNFRTE